MDSSPLAHNLRSVLKERDITQEALARAINASNRSVAGWCLGETLPRWPQLERVAKELKLDPGWFYTRHDGIDYDQPVKAAA